MNEEQTNDMEIIFELERAIRHSLFPTSSLLRPPINPIASTLVKKYIPFFFGESEENLLANSELPPECQLLDLLLSNYIKLQIATNVLSKLEVFEELVSKNLMKPFSPNLDILLSTASDCFFTYVNDKEQMILLLELLQDLRVLHSAREYSFANHAAYLAEKQALSLEAIFNSAKSACFRLKKTPAYAIFPIKEMKEESAMSSAFLLSGISEQNNLDAANLKPQDINYILSPEKYVVSPEKYIFRSDEKISTENNHSESERKASQSEKSFENRRTSTVNLVFSEIETDPQAPNPNIDDALIAESIRLDLSSKKRESHDEKLSPSKSALKKFADEANIEILKANSLIEEASVPVSPSNQLELNPLPVSDQQPLIKSKFSVEVDFSSIPVSPRLISELSNYQIEGEAQTSRSLHEEQSEKRSDPVFLYSKLLQLRQKLSRLKSESGDLRKKLADLNEAERSKQEKIEQLKISCEAEQKTLAAKTDQVKKLQKQLQLQQLKVYKLREIEAEIHEVNRQLGRIEAAKLAEEEIEYQRDITYLSKAFQGLFNHSLISKRAKPLCSALYDSERLYRLHRLVKKLGICAVLRDLFRSRLQNSLSSIRTPIRESDITARFNLSLKKRTLTLMRKLAEDSQEKLERASRSRRTIVLGIFFRSLAQKVLRKRSNEARKKSLRNILTRKSLNRLREFAGHSRSLRRMFLALTLRKIIRCSPEEEPAKVPKGKLRRVFNLWKRMMFFWKAVKLSETIFLAQAFKAIEGGPKKRPGSRGPSLWTCDLDFFVGRKALFVLRSLRHFNKSKKSASRLFSENLKRKFRNVFSTLRSFLASEMKKELQEKKFVRHSNSLLLTELTAKFGKDSISRLQREIEMNLKEIQELEACLESPN